MLTISNPKTFDWANMDLGDCMEGNAADTHFTLKLYDLVMERLDERAIKLLEFVLMPSLENFAEMEWTGLDVDRSALDLVGRQLKGESMNQEDMLLECKGVTTDDNMSSNTHLQDIMYTREGAMELYPPDRTAKGTPSVSAPTLKILLEQINQELESRG